MIRSSGLIGGFSAKGGVNLKNKILKFEKLKEINGPKGLEPTRYGDWETKGITYDF